ncbi:MAG TPA: SDR family NAD(P)-dependent oxidoreductase [Burkholderiales bacterium]|nr:SDR family NAD(P)-dependent oxidoreductase [Burkholderiales bacterium]
MLERPKRKNPVLRTRLPTLPPAARSRVALGLTAAAAQGRFELQQCRDCSAVQYPPREACHRCLSIRLPWRSQPGDGELLSDTVLHHSNDLFFRERLPWRLGLVRLDCGPAVVAHLHGSIEKPPTRVRVRAMLDRAGQAVLVAHPDKETSNMADDRQLREFTCDPKFRKVLVTDGKSAVGQALVRALVKAGADLVWVGHAEPWKKFAGFDELQAIPQITLLPLDVTDSKNVREVAAEIGGKVDILVNNAEHHRTFGIANRPGVDTARAEMDVNYFGLLRLAQELGPPMRSRGADGQSSAVAWVNLLSIYALANFPAHGTFSASKAAAHSLSQCLRAEMRPAGVRVINAFPGPVDDEWNQLLPPPKVSPTALANAVVRALQDGVEDLYPGDVAQEWLERWRDNPKALERELSA